MEQAHALNIARQGVEVATMVLLPILVITLFLGLLVSIFQALTQIQEMTLTFVPKLIGVAVVMAMMGNWMLGTVVSYTKLAFHQIETVGARR